MEAEGLFYFWLWPQAVLEDDLVPASISSIGSSTKKNLMLFNGPENGFFSCVPFFGGHFDLLKDVEPEMSSCKVPTYNRIIFPLGTPFSLD